MSAALTLARRGLGRVWPNPAVGCVIVKTGHSGVDDQIVGRGWTQKGGRPHAETEALERAAWGARGATAYVTLEPCSHHGETPPCAEALIDAGVSRVVVAMEDPDPRVSGRGLARLREAGIEVAAGVLSDEAAAINAGFFRKVQDGRPLFTLKAATTLDGRIATHSGDSKWITAPETRAWGHRLRATHDAIMVGVGTAIEDDPELTCRLPGMEDDSPVRIIFDSHMRLPLTANVVRTARDVPTWIVVRTGGDRARSKAFEDCGVQVIAVEPDSDGYPDIREATQQFARRGLTRILVEGGSHLVANMLEHDLIDEIVWMRASKLIGGDGIPVARAFGVDSLGQAAQFTRKSVVDAGADIIETYVKRA
ncbi:MAG: bifunctional diaminohydroxyphosphoribosylaminopyrimidine deaminase/5-amino-6-(5-phosphoribosylamino)uracil reductase RibD [Rhodospirillales bacterium]|nr:bifunctional diaminohydroxyphosphoribosylaminopyrimidine deaminase/5-amino-6-(5-phosphoribosylamino)uracil reductase RibD [Rhodospirillales bacterium]MCW8951119.1 bifunctional diaminohydroxyphosphoribosylaminopyrimidine deaminase/5-amino-6-(5-phosphoribosylamino)uracil reductase RibD [Rhodospirillales bacterium]MCW9003460.1 bifunctional diaminohydroxyphosphoribosylaminopyrimidine deaminase/5-amino-6-(5-phosphoribosylamino)uracil reductase RibD [Rhodospirillales bacterium]